MRIRRTILVMLMVASTLTIFALWAHNASAIAIEWASILRAGPLIHNCGFAGVDATPQEISKVDACAQKAISERQKFRVVHQFWSMDSVFTYSIFFDGKKLLITGNDSFGADPVVLLHPHLLSSFTR